MTDLKISIDLGPEAGAEMTVLTQFFTCLCWRLIENDCISREQLIEIFELAAEDIMQFEGQDSRAYEMARASLESAARTLAQSDSGEDPSE